MLNLQHLKNIAFCYNALTACRTPEELAPFNAYGLGLAYLSKTDVHLQFEMEAFLSFYDALKSGMKLYGGWDGSTPAGEAFIKGTPGLKMSPDIEEFWHLADEASKGKVSREKITLKEAGMMKLLCDAYFNRTFQPTLGGRGIMTATSPAEEAPAKNMPGN